MNKTNLMIAILGAATLSTPALAERPNTYVFVNALYNNITTDVKDSSTVDAARVPGGPATTTWSIDPTKPAFSEGDVSDADVGVRVGGGLNFADHWGIEVSFAYYGETLDTLEVGGGNDLELTTRARAFSVDVIRYFDLSDSFSLFGKVGVDAWSTDIRALQQGKDADSDKDSGYIPTVGVGARYALGENVDLLAELSYRLYTAQFNQYQTQLDPTVPPGSINDLNTNGRYDEIDTDVEIIGFSLGAAYRF